MQEKRGRGRPKESDDRKILTMTLTKRISSASKKSSAELESELLRSSPSSSEAKGAYWRRFMSGERAMNPTEMDEVFKKAVKAGYLTGQGGSINYQIKIKKDEEREEDFGYLSMGWSLQKAKTQALIARTKDRAAIKAVAEARSALRKVKQILENREDYEWSCDLKDDRYAEEVKVFDDFLEKEITQIRFDRYQFDQDLNFFEKVLEGLYFNSFIEPTMASVKTIK
jgi:hypothetical protein